MLLVSSLIVSINSSYTQINLAVSAYYFNQAGHYMNEPEIAKKYYKLALIYNSKDDEIYNNLAVACQVTQDLNCAIENYQKLSNSSLTLGNYTIILAIFMMNKVNMTKQSSNTSYRLSTGRINR